jgi:hypothetical protein
MPTRKYVRLTSTTASINTRLVLGLKFLDGRARLLTLADATVAEVKVVPDRYSNLLTDQLQIVAIVNIAGATR